VNTRRAVIIAVGNTESFLGFTLKKQEQQDKNKRRLFHAALQGKSGRLLTKINKICYSGLPVAKCKLPLTQAIRQF
jgi:hypothetical protein